MLTEAGIKYNVDPSAPKTKAGKWSELPADQLAEFARVAGALNAELGYDQDPGPGGDASAAEASPLPEREQESIAVRARRQLAEARARVSGKPPPGFDREILNRLEYAEYVFERLLDAMHSDPRRIADILTEEVDIRVVGSEDEWEGRGSEQAGRLIDVLRADPALRGRQLRGDVHGGLPNFTAVLSYELPDGGHAERIVVARIRGDRVSGLSFYAPT